MLLTSEFYRIVYGKILIEGKDYGRNFIDTKVTRKNVVSSSSEIKLKAEAFGFNLYGSNIVDCLHTGGMGFNTLRNNSSTWLKRDVTLEEVHRA